MALTCHPAAALAVVLLIIRPAAQVLPGVFPHACWSSQPESLHQVTWCAAHTQA
jgi:hypothetical protein